MSFDTWIDTLIDEKGYDLEHSFNVPGLHGMSNSIPLGCVIDGCKQTAPAEQVAIKSNLIALDFRGADLLEYFGNLAAELAI